MVANEMARRVRRWRGRLSQQSFNREFADAAELQAQPHPSDMARRIAATRTEI